MNRKPTLIMLLCLIFIFKLVTSSTFSSKPGETQCSSIEDSFRFDCHPDSGPTQEKCEARDCCWLLPKYLTKDTPERNIGVPYCFYPSNYPGYYMVNETTHSFTQTIYWARDSPSYYPNDIQILRSDITTISATHMNIKFVDPINPRFEVPYFKKYLHNKNANFKDSEFEVTIDEPLRMKIIKKSTKELVFDTQNSFIYTDQYIQVSAMLPSRFIYGLGERQDNFLRSVDWQRFTMFASDQSPRENSNLYGSHPFFLTFPEHMNYSVGVALINSNAMDIVLQPAPAITFRILGGILDFHIFIGDNPADVTNQYINFIGLPEMPPFWSLGFHLCKYGYKSSARTREIWEQTRKAGIPYDVQWNDIDYMDQQRDFTYDKDKFSDLPQLVDDIHNAGMHYVVIIDPAMDYTETPNTYPPYDEGIKQDIFIKDDNNNVFIGKVWSPNGAVYPDFTNPKTTDFWIQQLSSFHDVIPYDGLWIDMNEPSNFLDGTSSGCPTSSYEDPPYLPSDINGGMLRHKTLCMTAKQNLSTHYNVHNLYGFTEAIATNKALKDILKKRPFIISRSTFMGQGHYSGHWSGDNFASWNDMRRSISDILDFNMFGIPLMGADICGFNDDTTVELCTRWMELGAFYPFSRNHNTIDKKDQDPVSLGLEVVIASKKALTIRYTYLPYLYTLFYRAAINGETVARSLLFEFPYDANTYGIDTQFLWGSAFMILPVLEMGVTETYSYFPKGTWYILENFQRIDSNGKTVTLNAPLDLINIAFRAGFILPFHYSDKGFTTTTESRKFKFGLSIFFGDTQNATGELFWDDGNSIDTIGNQKYNLLKFHAKKNKLTIEVITFGYPEELMILGQVLILGVKTAPTTVLASGIQHPFSYDASHEMLNIEGLALPMNDDMTVTWH